MRALANSTLVGLALLFLPLSPAAGVPSQVRAFADLDASWGTDCLDADIESWHTSRIISLENFDRGRPFYVFGEMYKVGLLSHLVKECSDSGTAAFAGQVETCEIFLHGLCEKEYKARTDTFLGNQYYGVGDTAWSLEDSEPCPPLEE